jgi:ectoine hydroxylase-related dioxygenase (phytanoyl-CoA dioxygenase family)
VNLTEQQLSFFDTFGFLAFRGLFADDIDEIIAAFERVWGAHGGGHYGQEHDGKQRSALIQFIDRDEYLCSLLDDPRIDDVCASVLGDNYNFYTSDGNFYVGDTLWHSDGYRDTKYLSFKMAFYLDPVTADTGCLRVIPGSHKYGDTFANMLQEVRDKRDTSPNPTMELWGVDGDEVPAIPLEVSPGDLLMFNHQLKHSSWGGGDRRRMFTLNFEQRYAEEDVDQIKNRIRTLARFWVDRAYGDLLVNTAGSKRMVHLEQYLASDGHLAELTREAREKMDEPSRG